MKVRTTKPNSGNKYYNKKANGGYSSCIKGKCKSTGKPAPGLNCLANCVGYASGAFNEEHAFGKEKYNFNCNAENFIERAVKYGLSVYQEPMVGGIMVWRKGDTLEAKDGAGHVAICTSVDDIYNPSECATSESGYNSSVFWTTKRKKGSGNWGAGKDYHYRGCIAPEGYVKPIKPTTDWTPGRYKLLENKCIRKTHKITPTNLLKAQNCTPLTKKSLVSQTGIARLKKGTVITCNKIYNESGRIWGSYGNCWVVICNQDGTPQAEKVN